MMKEIKNSVWVFHGANARFSSGVFSSLDKAAEWIKKNRLSGILTEYQIDESPYDWAISNNFFEPKRLEQTEAGFIQKFTSASQEHYHFENGDFD